MDIEAYRAYITELLVTSPMVVYASGRATLIPDLSLNVLHQFEPIDGVPDYSTLGSVKKCDKSILIKMASVFKLLLESSAKQAFDQAFSIHHVDERESAFIEATACDVSKASLGLPDYCWPLYTRTVAAYVRNRALKALFSGHVAPNSLEVSQCILATDRDVIRELWDAKLDAIDTFNDYDSTRPAMNAHKLTIVIVKAFQKAVADRYLYEYRQKQRKQVPLKPATKTVMKALKSVNGLLPPKNFLVSNETIRQELIVKWWNSFSASKDFDKYSAEGISSPEVAKKVFGLKNASKQAKDAATKALKSLNIYVQKRDGIYWFHPQKDFFFVRKNDEKTLNRPKCPHCKRFMGKNQHS